MKDIKVIGFDADDTLWVNEPFFQDVERQYENLLSAYADNQTISRELFSTEMKNISMYGYGAKGFTLSMIESALHISNNQIPQTSIRRILELGQSLLNTPVKLLKGVEETLGKLNGKQNYRLIVATKGDLTDQQRKLSKSGLEKYFDHIEIMSDKTEREYELLFDHLGIHASQFLMIGNSLKSDILPVLSLGGNGIHIPFEVTWQHEETKDEINNPRFQSTGSIAEILEILA